MVSRASPELVKRHVVALAVITTLSVILLPIVYCSALSEDFLHFTSRIQSHSELVYITDILRSGSNESILETIEAEKQVSLIKQLKLDVAFLSKLDKNASTDPQSAKFVIAFSSVQQTLDTISQV